MKFCHDAMDYTVWRTLNIKCTESIIFSSCVFFVASYSYLIVTFIKGYTFS